MSKLFEALKQAVEDVKALASVHYQALHVSQAYYEKLLQNIPQTTASAMLFCGTPVFVYQVPGTHAFFSHFATKMSDDAFLTLSGSKVGVK
jgi:hypothetical protein